MSLAKRRKFTLQGDAEVQRQQWLTIFVRLIASRRRNRCGSKGGGRGGRRQERIRATDSDQAIIRQRNIMLQSDIRLALHSELMGVAGNLRHIELHTFAAECIADGARCQARSLALATGSASGKIG